MSMPLDDATQIESNFLPKMSSTALFGHVDKFDIHGKESFPNYLERLEFYFLANDITDDGKKKQFF